MGKLLSAANGVLVRIIFLASVSSPCLAGPPPEWKEIKEEALKVFANPDSSPRDRLDAMRKVGAADCREAVDLLVKWCRSRTANRSTS